MAVITTAYLVVFVNPGCAGKIAGLGDPSNIDASGFVAVYVASPVYLLSTSTLTP